MVRASVFRCASRSPVTTLQLHCTAVANRLRLWLALPAQMPPGL